MVSQTVKFSDGTETVIRYKRSGDVELSSLDPVAEIVDAIEPVEEAPVEEVSEIEELTA